MIKRVCPLCGRIWYSAAEQDDWTCDSCGHNLTPEMNKPIYNRRDVNKVRINPVAFRYFRYKSRKSVTEIAGSHQAAATLVKVIKGETDMLSPYLLLRFAENMGVEVADLVPDEKSDNIIREFVEVE